LREINKDVPPPDTYDVKRNTDIKTINPKKPCQFGHSFASYRRTCDIQKRIDVNDFSADCQNTSQYYPDLDQAKKRVPSYTMGKAK
jgi:hypothetical protein